MNKHQPALFTERTVEGAILSFFRILRLMFVNADERDIAYPSVSAFRASWAFSTHSNSSSMVSASQKRENNREAVAVRSARRRVCVQSDTIRIARGMYPAYATHIDAWIIPAKPPISVAVHVVCSLALSANWCLPPVNQSYDSIRPGAKTPFDTAIGGQNSI